MIEIDVYRDGILWCAWTQNDAGYIYSARALTPWGARRKLIKWLNAM